MEQKERETKRLHVFNSLFVGVQLGLRFARTYGDFLNLFEYEMKNEVGDYTEEDELWAYKILEDYEKKNAL